MVPVLISASGERAAATDFTASVVMDKMSDDQRFGYISGLVDGLAYARFLRDGKQEAGMECIQNWFYSNSTMAIQEIHLLFGKYPAYPPAPIISTLVDRKCPPK